MDCSPVRVDIVPWGLCCLAEAHRPCLTSVPSVRRQQTHVQNIQQPRDKIALIHGPFLIKNELNSKTVTLDVSPATFCFDYVVYIQRCRGQCNIVSIRTEDLLSHFDLNKEPTVDMQHHMLSSVQLYTYSTTNLHQHHHSI